MSEFVRKLSDGEYDEYELPVRRWLLSYALISLLGLVMWNSAIELCGYNHLIDGAQASNALNWLYTYRNGVAHCLQVLEGDKETEKIVQIIW